MDAPKTPQQADEAHDLESAIELAHDHACAYGLWEVADDLDKIMRAMQSRGTGAQLAAQAKRGRGRRRT